MKIVDYLPIRTGRLVLKATGRNDIDLILKMDKQEDTQKFLGGIKNKSREERLLFLDKKKNNGNSLTVYLNETPIGFVGVKIENNIGEISYIFDSDYIGNGYCSEVVTKLIDICFNKIGLDMLYAYSKEGNIASKKVLFKSGFDFIEFREDFMYFELKR